MAERVGDRFHYSGAVHIHTTESDGTKPLEEIVEIGRSVDLDFMMFADHMGLTNREAKLEGRYGSTLVMIGYEHNDVDDRNHFLIFGSPDVYAEGLHPREYVAAARADGALGIIAHPIEKRNSSAKYPPYPWTAWDTNLFDGMELWNQMSEWMEKLTPLNQLLMALSPRKSMVGPTPEVLRIWDDLSMKQRCVGIAGADAHAFPVDLGPWRVEIFPYKVHFRCLRTHLVLREPLPDDFDSAKRVFYDAVRNCRVYISNSRWGCADRFEFYAERQGETATSGESLDTHEGARIVVKLPSVARIRLVYNGKVILQSKGSSLEHSVDEPGLYRVEAWKGKRGWIFSNHIRLGKVEAREMDSMEQTVISYIPETNGQDNPETVYCKFVIIETVRARNLIIGPVSEYPFHANLVDRFCSDNLIASSWIQRPDLVRIFDSAVVIRGGGYLSFDAVNKRVELSGVSKAYGAYRPQHVARVVERTDFFIGFNISISGL